MKMTDFINQANLMANKKYLATAAALVGKRAVRWLVLASWAVGLIGNLNN